MVYQAFHLALRFVTVDTEVTPNSPTAHAADRYAQNEKAATFFIDYSSYDEIVYYDYPF